MQPGTHEVVFSHNKINCYFYLYEVPVAYSKCFPFTFKPRDLQTCGVLMIPNSLNLLYKTRLVIALNNWVLACFKALLYFYVIFVKLVF